MKKFILTAFFLGIIYIPISCNSDGCNESVQRYNISNLSTDFGVFVISSEIEESFEFRNSTIYDSAVFLVSIETAKQVSEAQNNISFFSSALAEDCPYFFALNHELQSVAITSTSDIAVNNRTYEAGAFLNELFIASSSADRSVKQSIDNLVKVIIQNPDYFAIEGSAIIFEFSEQPDRVVDGTFTFTFIFDDRTLTTESEIVTIFP
ncbi:hypothetical protein [Ekhidna sp.]|uniref:hypothetical protein n=1 Tax=Ekhidna sp. TaxID=2608089 RepID=UPI003299C269